jgi:hypothetical protein
MVGRIKRLPQRRIRRITKHPQRIKRTMKVPKGLR